MSQVTNEVHYQIQKIQSRQLWHMTTAVDALLAMNTSESLTALYDALDDLQRHPTLYWDSINGLDAANILDAIPYYERTFQLDSTRSNNEMKEAALRCLRGLNQERALPLLADALFTLREDALVRLAVSLYAEYAGDAALYYLTMMLHQHPNHYVRRTVAKQMAYRFNVDELLPIAQNLLYADGVDSSGRSAAITLIWHIIIQHSLDGFEQDFVTLLKYAMFCVTDLGIIPYRCLMEIDVSEAQAAVEEWNMENKHRELPAAMPIFR